MAMASCCPRYRPPHGLSARASGLSGQSLVLGSLNWQTGLGRNDRTTVGLPHHKPSIRGRARSPPNKELPGYCAGGDFAGLSPPFPLMQVRRETGFFGAPRAEHRCRLSVHLLARCMGLLCQALALRPGHRRQTPLAYGPSRCSSRRAVGTGVCLDALVKADRYRRSNTKASSLARPFIASDSIGGVNASGSGQHAAAVGGDTTKRAEMKPVRRRFWAGRWSDRCTATRLMTPSASTSIAFSRGCRRMA